MNSKMPLKISAFDKVIVIKQELKIIINMKINILKQEST